MTSMQAVAEIAFNQFFPGVRRMAPAVNDGDDSLQPHQLRVVMERDALELKLAALRAFRKTDQCKALAAAEQERLGRQLHAMCEYSRVLLSRIDAFNHKHTQ